MTLVSMGEACRHMPPRPRAYVGPYTILPLVDDDWRPVNDLWVLPGRAVLTTQALRALADARGMAISIITR
jgi:hypothetical protein